MRAAALLMHPAQASVCLPSGNQLSLRDAAGVVLTAVTGRLWLTMEGEKRDIDLSPGATYTIERDGLTLVNALETSLVEVRVPAERRAAWRDRVERFWNWLARASETRAQARIARGQHLRY